MWTLKVVGTGESSGLLELRIILLLLIQIRQECGTHKDGLLRLQIFHINYQETKFSVAAFMLIVMAMYRIGPE